MAESDNLRYEKIPLNDESGAIGFNAVTETGVPEVHSEKKRG